MRAAAAPRRVAPSDQEEVGMEPPRRPSSTPWGREAAEYGIPVGPPGWEEYRAARERFLRTLQIDSLNRLLARPEVDPGRLRPGAAR